jgi:hypothetical protein
MYNTLPCFIGNVIRHFENEIYYKPRKLWRTLSVVVGSGLKTTLSDCSLVCRF